MSKIILIKYFYQISIFINFQNILRIFHFATNLDLANGKYLIKIIFDIKIEMAYLKYRMCQISTNSEHF